MNWLLIVVTFISPAKFDNRLVSSHDTIAQCHVAMTINGWQERLPENSEAVCIGVRKDEE